MNENQLCDFFYNQIKSMLKEKYNVRYFYYEDIPELKTCNFELLQELCKNKGFTIEKLNNSSFNQKENIKQWKISRGIKIFSKETLALRISFYD